MDPISRLQSLYVQKGKHAGYQALSPRLRRLFPEELIANSSRYEAERFSFIEQALEFSGKRVLDVGANAGYFTFEALERGAASVAAHEGDPALGEFLDVAVDLMGLAERVQICRTYFEPSGQSSGPAFDIALLMNVLHHLGADFGDVAIAKEEVLGVVGRHLQRMSEVSRYLVFQLGYCWKGDRNSLLFPHGTKQDQIDFVNSACAGYWQILSLGIPCDNDGRIAYLPPDSDNLRRVDRLGEFLNRPLFVMKSLRAE